MKAILILLIALFGLIKLSTCAMLQMDIVLGEERCVGHELDEDDEATFKVAAESKSKEVEKQQLLVTVTDPDDGRILYEKVPLGGKMAGYVRSYPLEVKSRGVYEMCFSTTGLTDDELATRVHFGIDSRHKKAGKKADPSKRVDKEAIPTLESELLAAEESLNDISREIEFARKQELLLKEATESTASRIQWFSIFSIAILLLTSVWQLIYLRSFFQSKKLL